MRSIYTVFILLLALMASAQCQQTAEEWLNEGDVEFDEEHYYAAIDAYEESISADPNNIEAWNRIGSAYSAARDPDKAIEAYETAIRLDPNCSKCWNNKGVVFLNQGNLNLDMNTEDKGISDFEAANAAFKEAVRVNSTDSIAWINYGMSLHALGKYDTAIEAYDEAIALDSNNVVAWGNKGSALRKQGKYNETIDCFNEAIRIDPSYKDYLGIYRGDDEVRRHFEEAERIAEQAEKALVLASYDETINQDPKNITARFAKAHTLLEWGDAKNATKIYDEADAACNPDAIIWINEGSRIMGSCEEAIRCFDRAIAICDESIRQKSTNHTAWNNKGVALYLQARADGNAYGGLDYFTDEASISKNLAHTNYRENKREDTLKCIEKAVEIDPECATVWYNKGIALYINAPSDSYEAIEYYDEILDCFAQSESLQDSEDGCLRLENRYDAKYQSIIKRDELRTYRDVERVSQYT
jgi:tetratricopeptide (TPR) repeat protein